MQSLLNSGESLSFFLVTDLKIMILINLFLVNLTLFELIYLLIRFFTVKMFLLLYITDFINCLIVSYFIHTYPLKCILLIALLFKVIQFLRFYSNLNLVFPQDTLYFNFSIYNLINPFFI